MANHASLIRYENEGKPVVRRGKHFIEFDLGNGQYRHVATIDPLHYGVDYTSEIDTAWEADTGAWQWRIIKNSHLIHSRNIFNVGSLFEWRIGEEWVIIDPQSINWINQDNSRQQIAIKQAVTGVATDDIMHFEAAYGSGRHYTFIAHPKRLIKHITVDSLSDLPTPTITGEINFEAEFTITNSAGIELYLDGVRWDRANNVRYRTSNRIEFRDANGVAQWYADAPVATDANGETVSAQYEVARLGGVYFIRVRVPREWMVTAEYPITIDPTFTDGYGGDVTTAYDTAVRGDLPLRNFGASVYLNPNSSVMKGLLLFTLSSIDAGATCNSATFYVYQYDTGLAVDWSTNIYAIASGNSGWPEGSGNSRNPAAAGESCWNAYEADGSGGVTTAWAGSAGLETSGTDYEASALGSISGNRSDAAGTEYSTALTASRIEDWFGATNTNYGLLIDDGYLGYIASSDNATTGYRPKLVVDYTSGGSASASPSRSASASASASLSPSSSVSASSSRSASSSPSRSQSPSSSPSRSQSPSASESSSESASSSSSLSPSSSPSSSESASESSSPSSSESASLSPSSSPSSSESASESASLSPSSSVSASESSSPSSSESPSESSSVSASPSEVSSPSASESSSPSSSLSPSSSPSSSKSASESASESSSRSASESSSPSSSKSASESSSPSRSQSPSSSPSSSRSASASASESSSRSASESSSASASPSPGITASVCWGHDTGVVEDNIRNFAGNWTGTGDIENPGVDDTERLALQATEYMISEIVDTGAATVELDYNHYAAGDVITLEYRHGATPAACVVAAWNNYINPFVSLGYVQIKVTSTL